ncbi:hypothetical protein [uncultured Roseobacter sp.]|uniref:hypothetical protein n=1 Tax=uncultured Roseobacter sp. TaxID=114847 RepID=UPI00260656C8|nr:hypothetical protein [uncultured Roseobacter sp.]
MDMDHAYADFVGISETRRPAIENTGEQFLETSGTALAGIEDRVKPAFFSFARGPANSIPTEGTHLGSPEQRRHGKLTHNADAIASVRNCF